MLNNLKHKENVINVKQLKNKHSITKNLTKMMTLIGSASKRSGKLPFNVEIFLYNGGDKNRGEENKIALTLNVIYHSC